MIKYNGSKCQYCQEIFNDEDDIVVCPECGAPYHRNCYKQSGECVRNDLHENHTVWESEISQTQENEVFVQCNRCGAYNPIGMDSCYTCQAPLPKSSDMNTENKENRFGGMPDLKSFVNAQASPINMDEEIDGVTVRELTAYVGQNSGYFIPRFLKMKKEKKYVSWNWGAFIFDYLYLFYRKTIAIAILFGVLFLILDLPYFFYQWQDFAQNGYMKAMPFLTKEFADKCLQLSSVLSYITLAIQILLGMFFNRFYMEYVLKKVRSLKAKFAIPEEFEQSLSKKGGVLGARTALIAMLVLFGISFAFTIISKLFL